MRLTSVPCVRQKKALHSHLIITTLTPLPSPPQSGAPRRAPTATLRTQPPDSRRPRRAEQLERRGRRGSLSVTEERGSVGVGRFTRTGSGEGGGKGGWGRERGRRPRSASKRSTSKRSVGETFIFIKNEIYHIHL